VNTTLIAGCYLIASILFILSLRGLSSPKSAGSGNRFGQLAMAIAIGATILSPGVVEYTWIVGGMLLGGALGTFIALRIQMTALPQLVAGFHSLVGLAAVCVALGALLEPQAFHLGDIGSLKTASLIEMALGVVVGAITFTGSLIAFGKLQGLIGGKPLHFPLLHPLNALIGLAILVLGVAFVLTQSHGFFYGLILLSFVLGGMLILPIGGADMPVVVSMLNSYSGWAAAGIGFTLHNNLLIITGALVGSSGAILSYIMCKGMNRSIVNVILGGFGTDGASASSQGNGKEDRPVKAGSPEDAAFIMSNSRSVIIVPGYGMAVAQAQHALREMADTLKAKGIHVHYAIHPVAGRMPGHMNVLLAEANVPYEDVKELEDINHEFSSADVAFVIGANDVTNPAAKTDTASPIYGMPVLDVERAKTVLFVKRSMAAGYAGVENELFFKENTMMLFGDAKKVCEEIVKTMD
jgi:NAD(P) transhydrogenase subunit beta